MADHRRVMTARDVTELQRLRSQILVLIRSWDHGAPYTADGHARYRSLCRREAELLERTQGA